MDENITTSPLKPFDVIVIGAGHAGCEAALASARLGCRTLLVTINLDMIAHMPCSPSIGGLGKGHLVKEIDALGGEMAKIADLTAIQYRTLNTRKGPAVQGTRTQNDKQRYRTAMKHALENEPNLIIKQALIEEIIIEGNRAAGVIDTHGTAFKGTTVVLTAGTFLDGLVHIGDHAIPSGRSGEFASIKLAGQLKTLGFPVGRMKTGTPARLHRSSIDFSAFAVQPGDETMRPFSQFTETIPLPQVPCHIGRTNERTHGIVRTNILRSPLYSGKITGVSARYCPSLEDKVMKFAEKDHHQIILEPEGLDTEEIYASGLGNSLPYEVQIELVQSVEGLEEAELMRPAYAIEYDFIQPTALNTTLETKLVGGLYFAGQVNGTSGYEEAAAQGLWAGINAALAVQGRPPFVLDRSEGYLGVMIDDLVTRGTGEPYRMFTSRAEYRLLLREDNADLRLLTKGYELGLHSPDTYRAFQDKCRLIERERARLAKTRITASPEVTEYLKTRHSPPVVESSTLDQLLKRPELSYEDIRALEGQAPSLSEDIRRQVEIQCKYEGYLKRQEADVNRFKHIEQMKIPQNFSYADIPSISNEIRQKLTDIRPGTLGRASRIPGITPAAVSILMVYLKKHANSADNEAVLSPQTGNPAKKPGKR